MSRVQQVMNFIDEIGAPPVSTLDWKDLLEQVCSECELRLEAVNEELKESESED